MVREGPEREQQEIEADSKGAGVAPEQAEHGLPPGAEAMDRLTPATPVGYAARGFPRDRE